ncbi:DUF5679 domain-containing protein [Candidatus Pacearchaeota archaeon]|nr:DUF5679 domain-containing protein [Candidatus Pacearchaeota archaeon]
MVKGRCMKCKEQVEMKEPVITQTSRGGYMAKGKCPVHTETTVCAMMSKDNAEKAIQSGEAKKAF